MAHYPEEISKLRLTISALDREKDNLQIEIDDKAEKLVQLEEELLLKVIKTKESTSNPKLARALPSHFDKFI